MVSHSVDRYRRAFAACMTTAEIGRLFASIRSEINRPTNYSKRLFERNSALVDCVLVRLGELALPISGRPFHSDEFAVAAIGGYGRREMYPFSDIDLAFIVTERNTVLCLISDTYKRLIREVQCFAPEIGIDYDFHHIPSLEHLGHRTLTAFLDMRWIFGNSLMFERFGNAFRQCIRERRDEFRRAKYEERHSVIATWGGAEGSRQCLNVKNGYGGLRDFHVTNWIGQVQYGVGASDVWKCMVDDGIATWPELTTAFQLRSLLRLIRIHQHIEAGYYENSVHVGDIEALAKRLEYSGIPGRPVADSFMQDCHKAMSFVGVLFERVRTRCLEQ